MITTKQLRNLAIDLLDDENGIGTEGYQRLHEIMVQEGNCQDILDSVDGLDTCFYIGEDTAEELRKMT